LTAFVLVFFFRGRRLRGLLLGAFTLSGSFAAALNGAREPSPELVGLLHHRLRQHDLVGSAPGRSPIGSNGEAPSSASASARSSSGSQIICRAPEESGKDVPVHLRREARRTSESVSTRGSFGRAARKIRVVLGGNLESRSCSKNTRSFDVKKVDAPRESISRCEAGHASILPIHHRGVAIGEELGVRLGRAAAAISFPVAIADEPSSRPRVRPRSSSPRSRRRERLPPPLALARAGDRVEHHEPVVGAADAGDPALIEPAAPHAGSGSTRAPLRSSSSPRAGRFGRASLLAWGRSSWTAVVRRRGSHRCQRRSHEPSAENDDTFAVHAWLGRPGAESPPVPNETSFETLGVGGFGGARQERRGGPRTLALHRGGPRNRGASGAPSPA